MRTRWNQVRLPRPQDRRAGRLVPRLPPWISSPSTSPSGPEGRHRSGHRPGLRDPPGDRHPDPPAAEQPDPDRRSRRRQDGGGRRLRPAHGGRRCPASRSRESRCCVPSIWACCRREPGVKGEFENRLKSVIAEVKASPKPIILFIDEAHTLIGAGGAAGQSDAANLLKPALARGELRTIAATTWMEYKKYFENDAALKRRFQVVKVEEPTDSVAISMMRGLTAMLEKHHKVRILDEAIEDAVKLSHRYITDRQLAGQGGQPARHRLRPRRPGPGDARRSRGRRRARDWPASKVEIGMLDQRASDRRRSRSAAGRAAAAQDKAEEQLRPDWKSSGTRSSPWSSRSTKLTARPDRTHSRKARPPSAEEEKKRARTGRASSKQLAAVAGRSRRWCTRSSTARPWPRSSPAGPAFPSARWSADEIETRADAEGKAAGARDRPGPCPGGDRPAHSHGAGQPGRSAPAHRRVHAGRPQRRRQDRDRHGAGRHPLRRRPQHGRSSTCPSTRKTHKISRLTGSAAGYVGYGEGGVLTEARPPQALLRGPAGRSRKGQPAVQEIFYQVFDKGMLQDDKGKRNQLQEHHHPADLERRHRHDHEAVRRSGHTSRS